MPRILVVEDEEKLRRNLQQLLDSEGYEALGCPNAEEAGHLVSTQPFDAIVLDLNLPGRDGLQVLAAWRAAGMNKPVLVLTARDSVEDRVVGLDTGADDYLFKPFAHAELLARLRALLRRGAGSQEVVLRCNDLEMHLLRRTVVRAGVQLELSQREFELLEYLVRNKNSNVTRDMIARDVWKEPGGIMTNAIDVCINSLRKKVELPGTEPLIRTIRGVGYAIKET